MNFIIKTTDENWMLRQYQRVEWDGVTAQTYTSRIKILLQAVITNMNQQRNSRCSLLDMSKDTFPKTVKLHNLQNASINQCDTAIKIPGKDCNG